MRFVFPREVITQVEEAYTNLVSLDIGQNEE